MNDITNATDNTSTLTNQEQNDQIQIIWSFDGIPREDFSKVLGSDRFPRNRVAIKLDRLFLTEYGLSAIHEVQETYQIPVFADAKIIEIPSKVMEITKFHLDYHPWMLNVMAGACNNWLTPTTDPGLEEKQYDLLYHFAKECRTAGTKSCAVTVLTSKTDRCTELERGLKTDATVNRYVDLLRNCNFTDIVCSPTDAVRLTSCQMDINSPGIRLAGTDKDDQSRSGTPREAIEAGVKRLVIGRNIFNRAAGDTYADIIPHIQKIIDNIEGRG